MIISIVSSLLLLLNFSIVVAKNFNYEVTKRVSERLSDFMNAPVIQNTLTAKYRDNDGFPNDMNAQDRDAYLKFGWTLMSTYKNSYRQAVFFGLEDGMFLGFGMHGSTHPFNAGWYREPGESGYSVDDLPEDMEKHYGSCFHDQTGQEQNCTMQVGGDYIKCLDDCSLIKCPDEDSQRDCTNLTTANERLQCENKIKWCRNYARRKAKAGETLGYIPFTYHCIGRKGQFTQTEGQVLTDVGNNVLGDCFYQDGNTSVTRVIEADFAYCGGNGQVCNDTFLGAFQAQNYDPRWRGWYEHTKELQKPNWSDFYPFFSYLDIGITYSEPIYSIEDDKNVFKGVLAIDYTLDNITQFLYDTYVDTPTTIAIFEETEPHYMIASTTGSSVAKRVQLLDESKPCTESTKATECTVARVQVSELLGWENPMDVILARAFAEQKYRGFPQTELVPVKAGDEVGSGAYYSQSRIFEQTNSNLKWRIVVAMPMETSTADSVTKGDPLFGVIITIGSMGIIICSILFILFYRKRTERAVINSDWRFTCAFILGCALLNWSTFTLLGPNTNATCMLRMWSFHFFFALALSPLFVKVWRMWRLVGSGGRQRVAISHAKAAVYTLPIIVIQAVILVVFSIVDPPQPTEVIMEDNDVMTQHIVCSQETNAFMIVELIYEPGLVIVGCVLAFLTRNIDSKYGESRQLIFAMYNIALIGLVTILVVSFSLMEDVQGKYTMQATGVFWGTCVSSIAFVLPRLIQARQQSRDEDSSGRIIVSGLSQRAVRMSTLSSFADHVDTEHANGHERATALATFTDASNTEQTNGHEPTTTLVRSTLPDDISNETEAQPDSNARITDQVGSRQVRTSCRVTFVDPVEEAKNLAMFTDHPVTKPSNDHEPTTTLVQNTLSVQDTEAQPDGCERKADKAEVRTSSRVIFVGSLEEA